MPKELADGQIDHHTVESKARLLLRDTRSGRSNPEYARALLELTRDVAAEAGEDVSYEEQGRRLGLADEVIRSSSNPSGLADVVRLRESIRNALEFMDADEGVAAREELENAL